MVLSALALALLLGNRPPDVDLVASYQKPAKAGANSAIAVTLTPRDPEIHVNEIPAPRIKLDPAQTVLVDRQPPAVPNPDFDPAKATFLDPLFPVLFPVAVAPGAPKGEQPVKATVVYFYCSKREGWCRRGTTDVQVSVSVP